MQVRDLEWGQYHGSAPETVTALQRRRHESQLDYLGGSWSQQTPEEEGSCLSRPHTHKLCSVLAELLLPDRVLFLKIP